ncbi:MAG: hypothetical protein AAFV59_18675, partial [Pseudomonadota bacterium]
FEEFSPHICGSKRIKKFYADLDGSAPLISIRDYDWGETDPDPSRDVDGFPFTKINWRAPAWKLGLSLCPPEEETDTEPDQ